MASNDKNTSENGRISSTENGEQSQQQQQQQKQHHPWDEVSLPGAGTGGPTEQPTILLINNQQLNGAVEKSKLKLELNNNTNASSSGGLKGQTTPGGSHVLDIESHLIEDANTYSDPEEQGVGIDELTPIDQELRQGTSKIEKDDASHVIEVQPAGAKTKQVIETPAPSHQTAEVDSSGAEQLDANLVREAAEELVDEIVESLSQQLQQGKDNEVTTDVKEDLHELNQLSQQVDTQINELTSILKTKTSSLSSSPQILKDDTERTERNSEQLLQLPSSNKDIKLVEVPAPNNPAEEEHRRAFIDSLPQIEQDRLDLEVDAKRLSEDCKREYYQSLKKYLQQGSQDKPPLPLQTYRWEDLRRAKERGGYPWTHLYKRPLGPDEEPEVVLLLRKSQELRFRSESPKSLKKVRYDEQVLVKETERYIQDLSEDEALGDTDEKSSDESDSESDTESETEREPHNDDALSECISCVSDSVLAVGGNAKPRKTFRLAHIKGILKRRRSGRTQEDAQSLPGNSANTSRQSSVHDLAPPPGPLVPDNTTTTTTSKTERKRKKLNIMKKLKSFTENQKKRLNIKRITLKKDDKIVLGEQQKIMKLKASPKSDRGEIPHFIEKQDSDDILELVEYEESPSRKRNKESQPPEQPEELPTTSSSLVHAEEIIELPSDTKVQEEPSSQVTDSGVEETVPEKAPRLRREHVYEEIGTHEVEPPPPISLGILEPSSVDTLKKSLTRQDHLAVDDIEKDKTIPLDRMGSSEEEQAAASIKSSSHLAPLSSIDSTASEEERARLAQLPSLAEEPDIATDEITELRPTLKKEASPAPSDKKVTFSHVEDEAEPHREDIDLPEEVQEAVANAAKLKNVGDHEYEPISVVPAQNSEPMLTDVPLTHEIVEADKHDLSLATDTQTNYELNESQDNANIQHQELGTETENRKKGFIASAQDRTRKMQDDLRCQADKLRSKLRPQPKKAGSGSPKAKERRRFKAPEFSKMKLPEIKRPDMSKFKDIKRPEFTKFNKPDMSKFKLPEKLTTLKLRRSKSFKENEEQSPTESPESPQPTAAPSGAQKKKFEFSFGTYPRAFCKKKPEVMTDSSVGTEGLSVLPSATETQQSSTSSPQGDRGPGPVRSRWADKFSDVSYNDSEGSRYRRFGSEMESFDRESSLERRMKEDLEDTSSDQAQSQLAESNKQELGILGGVTETKQFAEFSEENRAIHEISNLRSREFKRRPMVHQDSDLRSEDSRDAEGWTEKDIQKNKLLRKAELEAETSYYKYHQSDRGPDAQSTASSGKKVVMEEIDDDEFFLRKRGVSEDNIQLRQYISAAIREGYDAPNALQNVGHSGGEAPLEYTDFDVPPPKPRRMHHKSYQPDDFEDTHDAAERSDYADDLSMSQNGSDFLPKRPTRKTRRSSKYSMDSQSQDIPMADDGGSQLQYFDDDEEYLRPPPTSGSNVIEPETESEVLNNLNFGATGRSAVAVEAPRPQAPRRQKKRTRDDTSMEKESKAFINGFGGRSVSNTYLQPEEDIIVYRTEHEYPIPLATPETFTDGTSSRTQRSEDEVISGVVVGLGEQTKSESQDVDEKFVIDMMENDGYAVVRKEQLPKPTPPARRKKFNRSPGERFATLPSIRGTRGSPPPARPPPPLQYMLEDDDVDGDVDSPLPQRRRSVESLENFALVKTNYQAPIDHDDYEEPRIQDHRPESPRSNLQSGEVISKMMNRPLPPPPRPPREKRQRGGGVGGTWEGREDGASESEREREPALYRYDDSEHVASSTTVDSYDPHEFEVEVSTQTDPLPDDFVCEEFEITEDMKVIEPRRTNGSRTLDDLLRSSHKDDEEVTAAGTEILNEDEQLARGLQRFRDANQRSLSERSRASSQADRSKSLSRPQTPSAVIIERRIPTPSPTNGGAGGGGEDDTVLAALIVRPISAADLEDEELRREEEELRREGLLSDSSVQSKSDIETTGEEEEQEHISLRDYADSSAQLDAAMEKLLQAQLDSSDYESKFEDDEVERTLRDENYEEEQEQEVLSDTRQDSEAESDWLQRHQEEIEATQKELEEEMEKELAYAVQSDATVSPTILEEDHEEEEQEEEQLEEEIETQLTADELIEEDEKPVVVDSEIKFNLASETPLEVDVTEKPLDHEEEEILEQAPLPPPRRRSTTALDVPDAPILTVAEQISHDLEPIAEQQQLPVSVAVPVPVQQVVGPLADLEVERLRVHALQAGHIMVSQLHGSQISADELACGSGNLVVQNMSLPPGFIEDIVERVRNSEQRPALLTTETQTSRQASSEPTPSDELDIEPPVKPPRQGKALEGATSLSSHTSPLSSNLDEGTQTDEVAVPPATVTIPPPVAAYPNMEFLQSLAYYNNLQRSAEQASTGDVPSAERKAPHKCRRRHVQRQSDQYNDDQTIESDSELEEQLVERPRSRRSRTRSSTQPPVQYTDLDDNDPKTVVQAGRQFLSACSLELVNIINQLTNYVRGGAGVVEQQQAQRNVPTLMVLFILITFGVLVFLLTGRQVHTHHWDYFNPPGNEGRQV